MPRAPSCAPALCLWRAARSQKRLLFARRSPRGRTRRTRAHACRSSNSSSRASASTARRRSVAKPRWRPRSSTRVAMTGPTAQARLLCICRRSVTIGSFGPRRRRAGARAPMNGRAREAAASTLVRALRRINEVRKHLSSRHGGGHEEGERIHRDRILIGRERISRGTE